MLKKERLLKIMEKIELNGIITVSEMMESLHISDMTARRDLDELEKAGKLVRIHGGAQTITAPTKLEKSNSEKLTVQITEKKEIAALASQYIKDGETIFLGPGTTLECLAEELITRQLRIITNSLPVFNILSTSDTLDVILIGGEYRAITGAFVGSLASQMMAKLRFSKAFIGCNGIFNNDIATYSELEGSIQQLAFEQAIERFLLADSQKFNTYDFSVFYHVNAIDTIITDQNLAPATRDNYSTLTNLVLAPHQSKKEENTQAL
ncbi:DeoR/GlpR family DNA-binding transcription regulator [Streptococcus halichoeri]|uniref:DeoR/GlpR family DNA-binding transcription regulator n=1 Tax=Streptococcus halichoeri TaxID=254785 RepID=UPI000DB8D296|nr:DeoR/GlpR family DNA-binding transcription regulator [Streptococcus halichoeri]PZO95660.1 MAG: DeoR family transcriptional regulator [Streptococcus pyogenes]